MLHANYEMTEKVRGKTLAVKKQHALPRQRNGRTATRMNAHTISLTYWYHLG